MKTSALFFALAFGLHSFSHAQIFVGSAGTATTITFDAQALLPAHEWAIKPDGIGLAGGGTFSTPAEVAAGVQALGQNAITNALERSADTNNWESVRHNLFAGYLLTKATDVGALGLKATLRNVHTQAISHVTIRYNFGVPYPAPPAAETAPGHQVFFSTNGQPNSWQFIPALSGVNTNTLVTATIFVGRWLPNTDIYLLWADDNSVNSPEAGYSIDNFAVTNVVTTNAAAPLSITLTAPVNDTFVSPPFTIGANAAGSQPPTNVTFFVNGGLVGTDLSHPFALSVPALTDGTYAIYAVAYNATGSVTSATNTVRVRPAFVNFSSSYSEMFDGMGVSGTNTPIGWFVGPQLPAETFGVSVGDGSAGPDGSLGWNYGTTGSPDRALGVAATGTERNIVLRLRNNSAQPLLRFTLTYDGEVWRNYTNPVVNAMLTNYVSYDLGTNWTPTGLNFTQPSVPAPPAGPRDGNNLANRTTISGSITPPTPIPPGGVVYLRWHDFNDPTVDGSLAVDNVTINGTFIPANDTCAGAIQLFDGSTQSGNTSNATTNGDPSSVCFYEVGKGVWYRFTAGASGRLTLDTDANFFPVVGVYTSCGAASTFQCGHASFFFNVTANTTYWIFVAAPAGDEGSFSITASLCVPISSVSVAVDSVLNVPGGIQVTYRADYSGSPATSFEWSFTGIIPPTTTTTPYFSQVFSVTEPYPNIVSVRVFNDCGNQQNGSPVTPPCGAICLSVAPNTHTTTDGGSPASPVPASCGALDTDNTRWFPLGANQSAAGIAFLSISNSSPDTVISVYRGDILSSFLLVEVACATNGGNSRVARFETRPGTNYYVAARTLSPSTLNIRHGYELIPPAPVNDLCANAIPMSPGVSYSNNTLNATSTDTPAPSAGCVSAFGRGVWYSYLANATGPVLLSTCDSDFDTALQVYTGTSCGTLVALAGSCTNNNGLLCAGTRASLRFNATNGINYRILVGGANQAAGNLVISATPCTAPAITGVTNFAQLETGGVRVSYQAGFTGNVPHGWRWSFSDGAVFSTTSNSLTRLFGPFHPFPASLTLTATNFCGTNAITTNLAGPCGAICLASAVGTNQVHTSTAGSGTKTGTQSSTCGNFTPGSTLWFRLSTLTNAAGIAVISSAGSGFDTRLGVFRGTSITDQSALAEVTCNDNFNGTLQSQVEFETRAGTNYWLAVNDGAGAPLVLTYSYPVSFASVVLTNVGVNRALDLRTLPLPSYQYRLRGGTNLTVPLSSWSNLITTNFSNSISASTNILRYRDTNLPLLQQRYYRIERVP